MRDVIHELSRTHERVMSLKWQHYWHTRVCSCVFVCVRSLFLSYPLSHTHIGSITGNVSIQTIKYVQSASLPQTSHHRADPPLRTHTHTLSHIQPRSSKECRAILAVAGLLLSLYFPAPLAPLRMRYTRDETHLIYLSCINLYILLIIIGASGAGVFFWASTAGGSHTHTHTLI